MGGGNLGVKIKEENSTFCHLLSVILSKRMKKGVESHTDLVVRTKKQSAKEMRSRIGGRKSNFLRLTHEVLGQKRDGLW